MADALIPRVEGPNLIGLNLQREVIRPVALSLRDDALELIMALNDIPEGY